MRQVLVIRIGSSICKVIALDCSVSEAQLLLRAVEDKLQNKLATQSASHIQVELCPLIIGLDLHPRNLRALTVDKLVAEIFQEV
jgi:hypothetical protein